MYKGTAAHSGPGWRPSEFMVPEELLTLSWACIPVQAPLQTPVGPSPQVSREAHPHLLKASRVRTFGHPHLGLCSKVTSSNPQASSVTLLGCCYKLLQTWWLKTNLFLQSGGQKSETSFTGRKSRYCWVWCFVEALKGESVSLLAS